MAKLTKQDKTNVASPSLKQTINMLALAWQKHLELSDLVLSIRTGSVNTLLFILCLRIMALSSQCHVKLIN